MTFTNTFHPDEVVDLVSKRSGAEVRDRLAAASQRRKFRSWRSVLRRRSSSSAAVGVRDEEDLHGGTILRVAFLMKSGGTGDGSEPDRRRSASW
jgi:hypothetical protein